MVMSTATGIIASKSQVPTKKAKASRKHGKPPKDFSSVLRQMLEVCEGQGKRNKYMEWGEDGVSIVFKDTDAIVKEILPQFNFRCKDWRSFQRNLQTHGFVSFKTDDSPTNGSNRYAHYRHKRHEFRRKIQNGRHQYLLISRHHGTQSIESGSASTGKEVIGNETPAEQLQFDPITVFENEICPLGIPGISSNSGRDQRTNNFQRQQQGIEDVSNRNTSCPSGECNSMEQQILHHEHAANNDTDSTETTKFVGVDFFALGSNWDKDHDWNEAVARNKDHINAELHGLLRHGEQIGTQPKLITKQVKDEHGNELVAVRLQCEVELRNDLSCDEIRRIKRICSNIARLLRSAGADDALLKRIMIGGFWRGSICILLQAPSDLITLLFSLWATSVRKCSTLELGDKNDPLQLIGMAPVFSIETKVSRTKFQHILPERVDSLTTGRADVLIVKIGKVAALLPRSLNDKELLGNGIEYWRDHSDNRWKQMPLILSADAPSIVIRSEPQESTNRERKAALDCAVSINNAGAFLLTRGRCYDAGSKFKSALRAIRNVRGGNSFIRRERDEAAVRAANSTGCGLFFRLISSLDPDSIYVFTRSCQIPEANGLSLTEVSAIVWFNIGLSRHLNCLKCSKDQIGLDVPLLSKSLDAYEKSYEIMRGIASSSDDNKGRQYSLSVAIGVLTNLSNTVKGGPAVTTVYMALLNNMGKIHYDLQDYGGAERCFRRLFIFNSFLEAREEDTGQIFHLGLVEEEVKGFQSNIGSLLSQCYCSRGLT